jgi:hypothetical protein
VNTVPDEPVSKIVHRRDAKFFSKNGAKIFKIDESKVSVELTIFLEGSDDLLLPGPVFNETG